MPKEDTSKQTDKSHKRVDVVTKTSEGGKKSSSGPNKPVRKGGMRSRSRSAPKMSRKNQS